MKLVARLLVAALCLCAASGAIFLRGGGSASVGSVQFTPLTTYYMAASGCNDTNPGTSPAAPWCSPNHAVNAGDVIIAATGTYNGSLNSWGTVSNFPSTTGGTTGTGGVWVASLVCAGNPGTCIINCSTGACSAGLVGSGGRSSPAGCMNVNNSYWAIIGWYCNGNGNSHSGFQVDACLTTTTLVHHVAFINDITVNAAQGYSISECAYNHLVPGNGVDYFAVLGSIAQKAAGAAICLSAIDFVGPANSDALAGTHTVLLGNFAIANTNNFLPGNCTASDGEGMMLDTLDAHGYGGQIYVRDNIIYSSSWAGLQVFMQAFNSSSPVIYIENNTLYHNMQCPPFSPGATGEINLQIANTFPWTITETNNIALTGVNSNGTMSYGSACGSTSTVHAYANLVGQGSAVTITVGGAGAQNVFKGQATTCDNGTNCTGGGTTKDVIWFNSAVSGGTNTYVDPAFTNTADLLTNWVGAPSCSSFANVAACMGWNYAGQTATALTPISDLTPTAGGTSGKGYRPPGACAADALYPAWLNYVNYLYVSGSTVYEGSGLTNKPCNV